MCKKDEALKWASELLRSIYRGDVYEIKMLIDAANACANACKKALKENCQECEALKHDLDGYMQVNKEMLNKEWQGLTDEEVDDCIAKSKWNNIDYCPDHEDFAKHIEQKLKEKNHGTT